MWFFIIYDKGYSAIITLSVYKYTTLYILLYNEKEKSGRKM